jgi:hypothetical protein
MKNNEPFSFPENLVADVVNHKIYLKNMSNQLVGATIEIGAFQDNIAGRSVWLIKYANDDELANKLRELCKLGFLFIGGTCWMAASRGF